MDFHGFGFKTENATFGEIIFFPVRRLQLGTVGTNGRLSGKNIFVIFLDTSTL